MKTIGIKLADGSFYPVLQENTPSEKALELTTAHNNQTKIMVDLYRSATCSMDDAEYVDSLQIENLVAHPNGEPDISFMVSIDADNQLSAKIVDPETGNQSNTTITLVSRTIEERLTTDEYDINDLKEKSTVKKAVAGGGLLAAAALLAAKEKNTDETIVQESQDIELENPVIEEEAPTYDETAVEEPMIEETPSFDTQDSPAQDETIAFDTEETPATSDELPDFEETPSFDEEPTATEETPSFDEEPAATDEMPSFDTEESPSFDTEETSAQDEQPVDDQSDMDFSIPDIPDNEEINSSEELETPPDFFNMDDLDTNLNSGENMDFNDEPSQPKGLSFTGLYDKETELGESASSDVEEAVKRKTKVPVIICIICAIICLLATCLILFVIPSKFNYFTKKAAKEETVIEKTEPAAETPVVEKVPEAKEEEIIVIEKAEEVIPEPPAKAEEKPADITYKIKWGDTLWDIADTYYKNPWRYKYIARFNGIKNPDYIISGTYITIPAE